MFIIELYQNMFFQLTEVTCKYVWGCCSVITGNNEGFLCCNGARISSDHHIYAFESRWAVLIKINIHSIHTTDQNVAE